MAALTSKDWFHLIMSSRTMYHASCCNLPKKKGWFWPSITLVSNSKH